MDTLAHRAVARQEDCADKGWVIRTPADMDVSRIPPNYFKMLWVLESICRTRSYCWHTVASLAKLYGATPSGGFRRLLADMERDGWISRRVIDPGQPGAFRLGTFLHRRLDPEMPTLPRNTPHLRQHASSEAPHTPHLRQQELPQMGHQNKDALKKEESNNDGSSSVPTPMEPGTPEEEILMAKARSNFGVKDFDRVRAEIREHGIEAVYAATAYFPGIETWGGVRAWLRNWKEGGYPERLRDRARKDLDAPRRQAEDAARIAREREARRREEEAARDAEERMTAAWEALTEGEREARRRAILDERPELRRLAASFVESACITGMDG